MDHATRLSYENHLGKSTQIVFILNYSHRHNDEVEWGAWIILAAAIFEHWDISSFRLVLGDSIPLCHIVIIITASS